MAVITNTASLDGFVNGEMVNSVTNTATWNLVEAAEVTFTKAPATGTIQPGVPFDVTLTLTNDGVGDLYNIVIRDVLDPAITLVPDSVQVDGTPLPSTFYTFTGGVLTINPNSMTLGAGETVTITFQVITD